MKFFRSRLFRILVTLVSLIVIFGLSRGLYSLWKKGDIMSERKVALAKLEREQVELKKKLEEAQSPEFIEKAARENLGLIREGEAIVLVPSDKPARQASPGDAGGSTNLPAGEAGLQMTNEKGKTQDNESNWKKWRRLFF